MTRRELSGRLARLLKLSNKFRDFLTACVPGFCLPHESRIERIFWMEVDDQIEEMAEAVGDEKGLIRKFIHTGGFVQFKDNAGKLHSIGTPDKLAKYLLSNP